MSNKKRRRNKRGQSPVTGGRITTPQNKARGSAAPSGEQAIVTSTDGEVHHIEHSDDIATLPLDHHFMPSRMGRGSGSAFPYRTAAVPAPALRNATVDWDAGATGLEVFNIQPDGPNSLALWKATGTVPTNPDGTEKRVALRCDGGRQPVAPRIPMLIAQHRTEGDDDLADFIEAGHWFDAGAMTDDELVNGGWGVSPRAMRGFQSGIGLHGEARHDDVSWARMPSDLGTHEFDGDWPHKLFSNYVQRTDGNTGLTDHEAISEDWRSTPAPDMFSHRMGYHKDAPRDLGIPVDADGDHMLSHGDGCALAQAIHRDALDFWQSEFGRTMCLSYFLSQQSGDSNLSFSFPADTTVSTAPAYMAKKLAGAQVIWVDQMMAEVIDAGADLLWQDGVEHDSWPITTAEDTEVFDNVFVVSIQKDEYGTWPNVKWGTIGYATGGTQKKDWVDYQPGDTMTFRQVRGLYWIQMTDWLMPATETILMFDEARQSMTTPTMEVLVNVMNSMRERGTYTATHNILPGWVASSGCLAVSVAARSFFDYITRHPLQEIYIPRAMRRNAERKHGTIRPTIKIVTLPRSPHRPGSHNKTDRKLTCQFWVDEHRRYQHYPSLGQAYHDDGEWNRESHKPILIPGYVKGPEDRPWKASKGTVYRLAKKQEERGTL
jgi:hypothetical protein